MRWLLLAFALGSLVAACYQPEYPEGLLCNAEDGGCPPGMVCDRDGVCRREPLGGTCGDGTVDADAGEVCDHGADACCNDECSGPLAAGAVCRAAAGSCDVEETCDGSGFACPADLVADERSACDDCPAGGTACECSAGACIDRCGNGILEVPNNEACDGVAGPCPGFCQADCTCTYADSCQEYLAAVPGLPSGVYAIDPHDTGTAVAVFCDMVTDGGGWTGIDPDAAARLGATATAVVDVTDGTSQCLIRQNRLEAFYTSLAAVSELVCQMDIALGFPIDTIRVSSSTTPPENNLLRFTPIVGAGQLADIADLLALPWGMNIQVTPADGAGDIVIGTSLAPAPVLGLGAALAVPTSFGDGEPATWTVDQTATTTEDTVLRLQISESGLEDEGFRWQAGRIFVRKQTP